LGTDEEYDEVWIAGEGWKMVGDLEEEQLDAAHAENRVWQSEDELVTGVYYSFVTKNTYHGSGYVTYFDYLADELPDDTTYTNQIKDLTDNTYIDHATRLLSIDFTLYNPSLDMLVWGSHTTEFLETGDVIPTYHYRIYDEWKYLRVWDGEEIDSDVWALIVCEFIMYFYALSYLLEECKEMWFHGRKVYLSSWVNITELFNLFVFFTVFAFRYMALYTLNDIVTNVGFENDHAWVDLRMFGIYSQVSTNLISLNALISFMKVFKYLRFHRGLAQFVETIYDSVANIMVFLLIMLVIIISWALAFHVAFGHVIFGYMDFAESLFTLFKSTMGQFTIREIQEVNSSGRYLGPFLFISFIVVNMFVILSMLFAMVNVSFKTVRDQLLDHDENKHDDPIVLDIARCVNGVLSVTSKIPGMPQTLFTDQAIKKRKKRIARILSGESELVRVCRMNAKNERDKIDFLNGGDEAARAKAAREEEEDEIKRSVKHPRRDLLRHLVEVEGQQRSMLTNIETLSRAVRAQTFNKINKEMEDLVEGGRK
jgi:hypothetical protein